MAPDQSFEAVKAYLESIRIKTDEVDGGYLNQDIEAYVRQYCQDHSYRLWYSLKLLLDHLPSHRPLHILELGAVPYFFSAFLLRSINDCELIGANVQAKAWPGPSQEITLKRVHLSDTQDEEIADLSVYVFNFEIDPFPFEVETFDIVLCMEVIEHLTYSPTHMLAEAHRVLKKDGLLFLTTPNGVDMYKTMQLIQNRSIAHKYSSYGVYGRHNREFTASELSILVRACGYHLEWIKQKNVYLDLTLWPPKTMLYRLLQGLSYLPLPYFMNKRDYIFVLARGTGDYRVGYPDEIYQLPQTFLTSQDDK